MPTAPSERRLGTRPMWGAALIAWIAIGGGASAQEGAPAEPTRAEGTKKITAPLSAQARKLVESLDAPEFQVREMATQQLKAAEDVTLAQLESLLAAGGLSPEQFRRVEAAAKHRFENSPRAALGVRFDEWGARSADGVPISNTIEGFDSMRVLRPGDVLYAMSGVRVTSLEDARKIITSHDPGERMTIQLFRRGEPLLARATLGNFDDLDRTANPGNPGNPGGWRFVRQPARIAQRSGDVVDAAWAIRLARVMGKSLDDEQPIDPGVSPETYSTLEDEADAAAARQEQHANVKTIARPNAGDDEGSGLAPAGGTGRWVDVAASRAFGADEGKAAANHQADQIRIWRERLQFDLDQVAANLKQAADANQKAQLQERMEQIKQQMLKLDAMQNPTPRPNRNGGRPRVER